MLKERGKREGKTLGQLASELLAKALTAEGSAPLEEPLEWISRPMGPALVDLDDSDALYRVLDEDPSIAIGQPQTR
jgi:hypothetical protein